MRDRAHLIARPIQELLPVEDERAPLRVLIASLAPGGAERIVIDWLAAEAAQGREVELGVLHARRNVLPVPREIPIRLRGTESPREFMASLAARWQAGAAPVSTHLIPDDLLQVLWEAGLRCVPTVHNSREGWRNDPLRWPRESVPCVVACAEHVREELLAEGCRAPVVAVRHRPAVGAAAFDVAVREAVRAELGIGADCFLVGSVGAIKPQKDYVRAVEVMARLCAQREAAWALMGGVLAEEGLAELDRILDAAIGRGIAARLRLPGFAPRIEPYLAACDAFLNVSRFEGLSIATQEALAAGVPVVAVSVGGQREITQPGFELVDADAPAEAFASRLARLPLRTKLARKPVQRAPRAWSLPLAARKRARSGPRTLFVTANLNAGGAQRSLVNLARTLQGRHDFEIAVCGESTQAGLAKELAAAGVRPFRPAAQPDPYAAAESLLARAQSQGTATLCLWNVDARTKLLLAKFAPASLQILDVSPGPYAFQELEEAAAFAAAITYGVEAYYRRLDALVLKYATTQHPPCRRIEVIENGVALVERGWSEPARPRFVVSGRIAPSKRLETIIAALAQVRRACPQAELHVFGTAQPRDAAYLSRLQERCGHLPVHWRGGRDGPAHLREAYSAAVVLGTHQGSPNAVLEAMAAHIPVIANASGGTAALLDHGNAGWLLPEDATPAALAVAMEDAIASPQRARAFAERAGTRVRERHTLAAMARRYMALLEPESLPRHEKIAPWETAGA